MAHTAREAHLSVIPLVQNGRRQTERVKVSVAIPTHDLVAAQFMYSLANMSAYSPTHIERLEEYGVTMVKGTYVHSARQQLLQVFLQKEHTHILWLDSDMKFPRESLERLLAHGKGVVGINYCQRGGECEFVAVKRVGWAEDGTSQKLITDRDSTGLEEVEAIGFGMVLMRREVIESALPDIRKTPWFGFDWITGTKQVGEDVRFCKFLTDAGHKIWVDHDLSKECQHIGSFEYDCNTAEMMLMVNNRMRAETVAGD